MLVKTHCIELMMIPIPCPTVNLFLMICLRLLRLNFISRSFSLWFLSNIPMWIRWADRTVEYFSLKVDIECFWSSTCNSTSEAFYLLPNALLIFVVSILILQWRVWNSQPKDGTSAKAAKGLNCQLTSRLSRSLAKQGVFRRELLQSNFYVLVCINGHSVYYSNYFSGYFP